MGVHSLDELDDLDVTPFVRRAINSHLMPLIRAAYDPAQLVRFGVAAPAAPGQIVLAADACTVRTTSVSPNTNNDQLFRFFWSSDWTDEPPAQELPRLAPRQRARSP